MLGSHCVAGNFWSQSANNLTHDVLCDSHVSVKEQHVVWCGLEVRSLCHNPA